MNRWKRRISIAFGIYSTVLFVAYIIFMVSNREYLVVDAVGFAGSIISIITFTVLAALLSYRRPENRISWLFVIVALMIQASLITDVAEVLIAKRTEPSLGLLTLNALWYWWSGLNYAILAYAIILFPTGRLPSRRWSVATGLLVVPIAITIGSTIFFIGDINEALLQAKLIGSEISLVPLAPSGPFSQAAHVRTIPEVSLLGSVIALSVLSLLLLGFWSQIVRFREGSWIEKQQIKWVLLAIILWAFGIATAVLPIGIPIDVLVYISPIIPVAIAVAILRYRLFDIDLIIQRTLLYGLLTMLLALIFFSIVTLLQSLVAAFSGQESPLIIVISTLAIAALFNPLRKRIQNIIDRRFFRQKYNAELILSQFAATARDEVDLDILASELVQVTRKSLQPESVTIWLVSRRGE